jgi:hypothetical protein
VLAITESLQDAALGGLKLMGISKNLKITFVVRVAGFRIACDAPTHA